MRTEDLPTTQAHVPDGDDDLTLIRAYRDGDPGAFDQIFTRYHTRIRALCVRYVSDEKLAEDLVQETFYNVLKTLGRVDDGFHFSAWIHRIAINLCHDELRRGRKHRLNVDSNDPSLEEVVLQLVDHDRQGHPEDALEITQLRRVVWEVAKRLPERQRMVLTLRELQGLSYASIGHVMGISQSAVETLLHRARKRFKEVYLSLDGEHASGDCGTVAYLLETVGGRRMRRDQQRMVLEHLEQCSDCTERFPMRSAALAGAGEVRR
jgi:RNA polymerase sigma factor (sigma-70 family)